MLLRLLGLGFLFFGVFLTNQSDVLTEVMVEYVNYKTAFIFFLAVVPIINKTICFRLFIFTKLFIK